MQHTENIRIVITIIYIITISSLATKTVYKMFGGNRPSYFEGLHESVSLPCLSKTEAEQEKASVCKISRRTGQDEISKGEKLERV